MEAAMRLKRAGGGEFDIEILDHHGAAIRARVGEREVEATIERAAEGGAILALNGARYRVFGARLRDRILVAAGPASFEFKEIEEGRAASARGLTTPEVTAPMPGKVLRVLVSEGGEVAAGDGLLVLEAMKMETTIAAESPARIKKILVREGQSVDHGAVLIELAPLTPSAHESGSPDP
jgi:biotin carboxyl carrier protein